MDHRGDPGRFGLFVISRRLQFGSNNCCQVAGLERTRAVLGDYLAIPIE